MLTLVHRAGLNFNFKTFSDVEHVRALYVKPRFWNTTFAGDRNFYFINHLDFGINPDFGIHLLRTNWYSKIGVIYEVKISVRNKSSISKSGIPFWNLCLFLQYFHIEFIWIGKKLKFLFSFSTLFHLFGLIYRRIYPKKKFIEKINKLEKSQYFSPFFIQLW